MSLFRHPIKDSPFPTRWMDLKPYIPVPRFDWIENKRQDVAYGTDPLQKLDLYYPNANPQKRTRFPLLVIFHGGGFSHMDKADWHVYPGFHWLEMGYMVASVNYRLAPKDKFPKGMDDCLAAVAFLFAHAAEFKIDAMNTFLMGPSAGGSCTLITGLRLFNRQEGEKYRIAGLAALCPVVDLTTVARHKGGGLLVRLLVNTVFKDYLGYRPTGEAFSPFDVSYHLGDRIPPIYFQLGEKDPVIDVHEVSAYAEALKAKGEVVLDILKGGVHMGASKHFFLEESIKGYLSFFESKIR